MQSTSERMFLRESLLKTYESLNDMRDKLLALAGKNLRHDCPRIFTRRSVPTNYVRPLSAGMGETFDRDARTRQVYGRLNMSPLGWQQE